MTLANPPPRAGLVTLRSDPEARTVAVTGQPSTHWIAVGGAGAGRIEIEGAVNVRRRRIRRRKTRGRWGRRC
ncbi:MAG: hypothetical protein IPK80_25830 [Nannocystis sp.]|nr:hypothetical protein [Nannocystis sp.]